MLKRLVLITSGFPYGKSETFLESEISYLASAFDEVVILCPEPTDPHLRNLPNNCTVDFYTKTLNKTDKIKSIFGLFSLIARKEIEIIRKDYKLKLTKGVLSTLLISLYQAKRIAKVCQNRYLNKDQKNIETVFYSYWCDDTALALALLKQSNPQIKSVSRAHGWDVYFNVHELKYLPFRHFISKNLNAIFPISEKGKQEIEEVWKVNDITKVKVARLGVNKQTQSEVNKSKTFTLVSCSNVIPLKRVKLIAEMVLSSKQPIKWIHFGDGSELELIQKFCKENQQDFHNISFHGRVSNDTVLNFYKTNWIDAFINTSSSEGIPVSIMEAMSFGIPCIATDVGGNSEIVNNINGVLLNANPSLNDIQDALKEVLNSPQKREAAYNTWKEKYNAEKNYKEFIGLMDIDNGVTG